MNKYENELKQAYRFCSNEELNEYYFNANTQERKRITLELKRRNKEI